MSGGDRRAARRAALERVIASLLLAALLVACASGAADDASTSGAAGPGISATGAPAPDFSLVDQFGHRDRLSDLRGQIVLLTFIDSRCTTICPLTAQLMTKARASLGPMAASVRLVAINANPRATSVQAVRRWSAQHRMTHRWLFLTGSTAQLRSVWRDYGIQSDVVHGDVAHTAVVFVIDATGRTRTALPIASRSGIDAEARTLARAVQLVANGS